MSKPQHVNLELKPLVTEIVQTQQVKPSVPATGNIHGKPEKKPDANDTNR
jgi:hypothetical protein